jgi:iron-sulfur cluster assembly accessory protein
MTTQQVLNVTQPALDAIKARLNETTDNGIIGLRVGIKAAGCSGFAYFMEFAKTKDEDDEVVERDGVKVLVDANSMVYLLGTTIDYVSSDMEEGFVFNNPNEKGKCGCGESFSA